MSSPSSSVDGTVMDSPILPERADDEAQTGDRRPQPWYTPRLDVLRGIAVVIALVGAIIGLASRWETWHRGTPVARVATVILPAISHAVYGEPTLGALRPATRLARDGRRVCVDELRPRPRGAWHCDSWETLAFDAIGAQARDRGGPCTHRTTVNGGSSVWQCRTRIAIPEVALHMPYRIPVFFGDLQRGNGIDQRAVAGVCWIEVRASSHAPWRCGSVNSWRPLLPSFRAVQAVDPGGPCLYREADEATGVWWCLSRT
jgi:hypothetical protein